MALSRLTACYQELAQLYTSLVNQHFMFQVCYGMIYGIGAKALGKQLEVEENDAAVFIETFKAKYPGRHIDLYWDTSSPQKTLFCCFY